MRHVGFTGTRLGMTEAQKASLLSLLSEIGLPCTFHHGDCTGADSEAHEIARKAGMTVVVHPPEDETHRAWCVGDETRMPLSYRNRNKSIVDDSAVLIAAPSTRGEELRSGTWMTVRIARMARRRRLIIGPSGRIDMEGQ